MGRRVSVVQQSSGVTATPKDPFEQPCFSSFGGYYNSAKGWFTLDHNLNMSNVMLGANGAYNSWTCDNNSYSSEFSNNYASSGWIQTSGQPGGDSSYASLCTNVGYLGNMNHQSGSNTGGNNTPWIVGANDGAERRSYGFRDVCTLPGETHQDYAVFMQYGNSGHFRVGNRSASEYWINNQYAKDPVFSIPMGWDRAMYGTCSYNRKRNKLAIMETDDGYSYQPFVWSDVPNLRSYAHSRNFYQGVTEQANAIDFANNSPLQQWFTNNTAKRTPASGTGSYGQASGKPTNGSTEDQRRGQLVICDNDRLVMFQMIPGYGSWVGRWNSPTVDGNGNCQGSIQNMSWTTSYGQDQGNRYGSRFVQTSDGRYIAAFCPSYYYGAGLMCTIIRVSDGKSLHTQWNSSGNTVVPIPYGKSSFLMCSSENTDSGYGVQFTRFNCDWRFGNSSDNSNPSMLDNYESTRWMFDHAYHSTSYPTFIPHMYDTSLFTNQTGDVIEGYDKYST